MINIFTKVFSLILFLSSFLSSQNLVSYEARLMNDQLSSPNKYEFDIYIKHTGGLDTFQVYGLQVALLFNDSISNGSNLSAVYITGTSQMTANQIPDNPNITSVVGGSRVFKLAAKYAFNFGEGTVISKVGNGTRLGRFCIRTDAAFFPPKLANLRWTFSGFSTNLEAWIDENTHEEITDSNSHFVNLQNNPLPVELNSFELVSQGRIVKLSWQTKTETNSNLFEIQRQNVTNNGEWIKIGNIIASGNSNSPKDYSYSDLQLNVGIYKYRLKIIDNDGSYTFSEILETQIELPKEYSISQNYPNPFNPSTNIDYQLPFDSEVNLEIFNITGERAGTLVSEKLSAGYYTIYFDATALNLASGIYIYRLTAKNSISNDFSQFVQSKKLVLMK